MFAKQFLTCGSAGGAGDSALLFAACPEQGWAHRLAYEYPENFSPFHKAHLCWKFQGGLSGAHLPSWVMRSVGLCAVFGTRGCRAGFRGLWPGAGRRVPGASPQRASREWGQVCGVDKTTADHRKYHTPLDTAIRTLRIETSKRGRPNTPRRPSSAGSSQKDLDAPIPKELGLPSLEGGMLGTRAPPPAFPRNPRGRLGFPGPPPPRAWLFCTVTPGPGTGPTVSFRAPCRTARPAGGVGGVTSVSARSM